MRSKRSPVRKLVAGAFLLILCMLTPFALEGWRQLYRFHLEREAPTISIPNPPVGIGSGTTTFDIEVADDSSGLDLVIISREQDGETKDLLRKRYDKRVFRDTLTIALNGKEQKLLEGPARIHITVFDKSFFSNGKFADLDLRVDYVPPAVEVLSMQHNAVVGGSELVFYRVKDRDETVSFVKVGPWLFQGFRAEALDPAFKKAPGVYFAFFAIPLEFKEGEHKLSVFARDQVGNSTAAPFFYRVGNFGRAKREIKLSDAFMRGPVDQLYGKYREVEAKLRSEQPMPVIPAITSEDLIARFRAVNGEYRNLLNHLLEKIFSSPKPQRFWQGAFTWLPGKTRSFFGEEQRFTYQEQEAGTYVSQGVDLASQPGAIVPAANDGIVIFADDLNVYGKTVIIDHGFGLTSLYAQLRNIASRNGQQLHEGDRVAKGEPVGYTGSTGLAQEDLLHFEMRLLGIPVRPAEWWDKRWVADHVDKKIEEIKKVLGLQIITPID